MSFDETRVGAAPQASGRARTAKASLVVVHAADEAEKGRAYALGDEDVTIGREAGNTVVVGSDQASRRHARIFVSGGVHVLVDLDSTNGTFLNSKLVQEQTLRHGDVVRIASTVLKYVVES
ncbi:FHA domain-containing protein [Anaeromyxobacter terrae]|uniref:FHA domain-containing protein n=1 Tax=Anaeromyxobacter terrae TaxID=2925406 RepID=UPI001F59C316|nr:FHA domain-containing protein [Anaeromyxobacter sp. SG22]